MNTKLKSQMTSFLIPLLIGASIGALTGYFGQCNSGVCPLTSTWWTIFGRCAEPTRPREAVTSRPLMLCAVGRIIQHAGQSILRLTSSHAEAARAQQLLSDLSMFLSSLFNTAEQLSPRQRWERIWRRVLEPYRARAPAAPPRTALAF